MTFAAHPMLRLFLLSALVLCYSLGWGQLTQSHLTLELGQPVEGEQPTATLTLRNQGLVPIRLARIEAPCAVRVLRSPRGFIPPGSRAVIELALATSGRLGLHDHTVTIHHTGIDPPLRVRVRADVQRRTVPVFSATDTIGPLAFSSRRESLKGLVRTSGPPREFSVRVMNIGTNPVVVFDSLPGAFELLPARQVIGAGQSTQLLFRYRPGKWLGLPDSLHLGDSRWRGFEHRVQLYTTAPQLLRVAIDVTGVFDPGATSDQLSAFGLQAAPELVCPKPEVRLLGSIRPATTTFKVSNRGDAPLRLHPASASLEGLEVVSLDSVVAPHSEGKVVLAFKPPPKLQGYSGPLTRTLAISTSDPRRRLLILTLSFNAANPPRPVKLQHKAPL
jgi:hypothetical protein